MGGDAQPRHLVTAAGVEDWPDISKAEVAARLVARIAAAIEAAPARRRPRPITSRSRRCPNPPRAN